MEGTHLEGKYLAIVWSEEKKLFAQSHTVALEQCELEGKFLETKSSPEPISKNYFLIIFPCPREDQCLTT